MTRCAARCSTTTRATTPPALLAYRGELDHAEEVATEAFELGRLANLSDAALFGFFGAILYLIRQGQGRIDELVPLLEERVAELPDVPVWRMALAGRVVGERPDRRGTRALRLACRRRARQGAARRRVRDNHFRARLHGLRTGPPEAIVRDLYERLLPFAHSFNWTGPTIAEANDGSLAMLAAALGRHEVADRHFTDAIEFCERAGARHTSPRTHAYWAMVLASRADAPAREHAEKAIAVGTEIGSTGPHGSVARAQGSSTRCDRHRGSELRASRANVRSNAARPRRAWPRRPRATSPAHAATARARSRR